MMEQRRALTLPFTVDKDNLMENPLRIPMTCLSSECAKLGRQQVSWTALSGCKHKSNDVHLKNGSTLLDHNHAAMVRLELDRRKPCLVLTDVLKTDHGKAYIERMTKTFQLRTRSTRRQSSQCMEENLIRRGTRSRHKSEVRDNDNKSDLKTTPTAPHRSNIRRKLLVVDKEGDKQEENTDIEEVMIGKHHRKDDTFAEVVDCGLSVSWEPDEDTGSCDKSSAGSVKDKLADSEGESPQSLKRKRNDMLFNGTSSPKRQRESVLRLTGEDGRDAGPVSTRNCLDDGGEDGDVETLDRTIVQFTVGANDRKEIVIPIISPDVEAEDITGSPKHSPSSNPDNATKTRPSEPIVLSSDEEESGHVPQRCSPLVLPLVAETVIQGKSPQKALPQEQEASNTEDMQVLQVVIDLPPPVTVIPSIADSCISVTFSALHCGCYRVKSNGDLMLTDTKFIIPLKDPSEKADVILTLERKEVRRYSVWEQHEMETQGLCFQGNDDPFPPAVLLFCVSETAAAAVQRDLLKLCVKQDRKSSTVGKGSPFILLTLKNPLEGMEGALMRSLLDIDCLNSLADEKSIVPHCAERFGGFEDLQTPVLSLDESIELIRRTGLDSRLLTLLGFVTDTEPEPDSEQDVSLSKTEDNTVPLIQLQGDSQRETVVELETETKDTGTQQKTEEDQKEQSSEKKKEESTAAYTLCHVRTKGSYSVSLCKPDSSWIKYKHKGLTRRLIQFPPPPLKGGITVTMEDLQCLDSGQFLNDVIIDFYLKYLLQMTSAAVAERSHIFSSFFYKQLTRRDNANEGMTSESCQRQRRHQRVKTWTRHVDIFKKDFVFVPVNQEAHWYLVVICFPGLEEPKSEAWKDPDSQTGRSQTGSGQSPDPEVAQGSKSPNDNTETPPTSNHSKNVDTGTEDAPEKSTKDSPAGPVNCTEQTCQKKIICKRPCILIMDSLKLSLHERVFKLLREYLQSEWEVRRGSSRDFSPDQMQSSHCQVPLQDNSSDCGLYLLQFVESFLKDPVVHFDLPLRLERWFPRQLVRRKRDEIRDLVLNLYQDQNLDSDT